LTLNVAHTQAERLQIGRKNFVGGCDIVREMLQEGKLTEFLSGQGIPVQA